MQQTVISEEGGEGAPRRAAGSPAKLAGWQLQATHRREDRAGRRTEFRLVADRTPCLVTTYDPTIPASMRLDLAEGPSPVELTVRRGGQIRSLGRHLTLRGSRLAFSGPTVTNFAKLPCFSRRATASPLFFFSYFFLFGWPFERWRHTTRVHTTFCTE